MDNTPLLFEPIHPGDFHTNIVNNIFGSWKIRTNKFWDPDKNKINKMIYAYDLYDIILTYNVVI